MNRLYHLIFLIFIFTTGDVTAQKYKVQVVFNFGDTIQGYGGFYGDHLKFRKTKKSNVRRYDFSIIKTVKFLDQERANMTYAFIKVEDGGLNPLEIVMSGLVTLYRTKEETYKGNYSRMDYYVKRKHEKEATHLGSNQVFSKNFKRTASKYFNDCPDVVEKIEDKEFKKKNIIQMVYFYNINCK